MRRGWEGLYRRVLRISFPARYPDRLLDQATATFGRTLERRRERRGAGAGIRYAVASCARAGLDGLAERAEIFRLVAGELATGWTADVRFALRQLVRRPLPAVVAVLSLAAGVGANTLLFSIVDATLLAPLPVPDPDRLVRVFDPDARTTLRSALSLEAVRTLDREAASLEGVAGVARLEVGVEVAGEARLAPVEMVTPGYFDLLGVPPARGRGFRSSEADMGGGRVVVLSHRLWSDVGAGTPPLVGETVRLNRETFTVVGVAPEGFGGSNFTRHVDLWVPTGAGATLRSTPTGERTPWLAGIARLRPGADVDGATRDVERVMAELHRRHPEAYAESGYFVLEERAGLINPADPGLVSLAAAGTLAAALLVLVVACLNVAGLTLARVVSRKEEMGVRMALGSGRARLARQMLVETAILAAPAVAVALAVATAAEDVFVGLIPPLSRLDVTFGVDARMLAFATAVGVLAVAVAGLLPALLGTRDGPAALIGGRGERGASEGTTLRRLVTLQVAFSATVLVLGGLFLQTLEWYRDAEPGYAVDGRVAVSVDVGLHGLDETEGRSFFRSLVREARALPGVEAAALARGVAAGGPTLRWEREDGTRLRVDTHVVGPGYFETLEIRVTDGRGFDDRDGPDGESVAVVNRTLARRMVREGESPVGRLLETADGMAYRVVGVARDVKYGSLAEDSRPFAYLPADRHYADRMTLLVAAGEQGTGIVPELRRLVERLRPGLPLVDARSVAAFVREDRLLARAAAAVGAGLGGLSLFLAGVGLYGTLAFSVQRRRPELAVRKAVGAAPDRIFRDVLARGLRPVGWGLAIGLPVALAAGLALRGLLVGTSPLDVRVLAAVPALQALVAVAVLLGPARSAASLNARDALRGE